MKSAGAHGLDFAIAIQERAYAIEVTLLVTVKGGRDPAGIAHTFQATHWLIVKMIHI